MELLKNRALALNGYRWDKYCRLNNACRTDISWWIDNLPNSIAPIWHPNPHLSVQTDALNFAWGGICGGLKAQGHFSLLEQQLSINSKETLAVWYSFLSFRKYLQGKHVLFQSDNTTAISFVSNMGGMTSDLRSRIVHDLWHAVVDNDCWISIVHLPGVDNWEADSASRVLNERIEWKLNPLVLQKVLTITHLSPTIDMFASRLNYQFPWYLSYNPDPYCEHVDCFTLDWKNEIPYSFLPFNVVFRAINKIRKDNVHHALMIVPTWPNQIWFSTMLTMLVDYPLSLLQDANIVTLPWKSNMTHQNLKSLKLLSVVLCGTDTDPRDFRSWLPNISCQDSQILQGVGTLSMSKGGMVFASRGKLIHCNPLTISC